jgi:hypothetical protein
MAERYQLPRSFVPPTTRRKDCGCSPSGGSEGGKTRCIREREDMVAFQGGHPSFKGNSPHLRPQPSRAESSPTCSKVPPYDTGAGSHASCKMAQGRRSQTAARGACNCPAVTSIPPLLPDQRVKGRAAMQSACKRAKWAHPFDSNAPGMEAQAHTSCNRRAGCYVQATAPPLAPLRASSTAERVPRLEATLRMTQQCPPGASVTGQSASGEGATVDAAKNAPTVMAVAGGRKQQSRRQPSSRPIQGQQGNPLSRRKDSALVFRSSNGSRTRNGCPANHSPRCINSAAGQAAPLAGEAGDASPSP